MDIVNATSAAPSVVVDWFSAVFASANAPAAIALVSLLSSLGLASLCAILPCCLRLIRGQDLIAECKIGRSVLSVTLDVTGNGLHASKKLVVDVNNRKAHMVDTGDADSPARTNPLHA